MRALIVNRRPLALLGLLAVAGALIDPGVLLEEMVFVFCSFVFIEVVAQVLHHFGTKRLIDYEHAKARDLVDYEVASSFESAVLLYERQWEIDKEQGAVTPPPKRKRST